MIVQSSTYVIGHSESSLQDENTPTTAAATDTTNSYVANTLTDGLTLDIKDAVDEKKIDNENENDNDKDDYSNTSHPLDYEIVNENIRIFIRQSQSTSEIIGNATAIDIDNIDALIGKIVAIGFLIYKIKFVQLQFGNDEATMDKTDSETQQPIR